MINLKESKQIRMDSWLLKLLSKDMKTKTKSIDQEQTIIKNKRKIKHNWKVKAIRNITPTIDLRNGKIGGTDPKSDMSC